VAKEQTAKNVSKGRKLTANIQPLLTTISKEYFNQLKFVLTLM